ncbi:Hypothetical protein NTJ_00979 [Nesidiocoris tenuis]|uniref:MADF domain-containing protein n=1 Tax=Nesidiocoris tenuis TaxID=355587 RepID=A0ABN7A852_9HEMI|nr:Hypothetical protein NTJ_00979 [Nesidiocoris tenuis]
MTSWTVNEEIEIIYPVQARPALWNVASREYEQAPLKALMWAEVDKAVGKSGWKSKWTSMRDAFSRSHR